MQMYPWFKSFQAPQGRPSDDRVNKSQFTQPSLTMFLEHCSHYLLYMIYDLTQLPRTATVTRLIAYMLCYTTYLI